MIPLKERIRRLIDANNPRLCLINKNMTEIRAKTAEIQAVKKVKGYLTSKYSSKMLDREEFKDISKEDKLLLKENWSSFDIFKPFFDYENNHKYLGFCLIEVKSKLNKNKNKQMPKKLNIKLTHSQVDFFSECKKRDIDVFIYGVVFFDSWELECKYYSFDELTIYVNSESEFLKERRERMDQNKFQNMRLYGENEQK